MMDGITRIRQVDYMHVVHIAEAVASLIGRQWMDDDRLVRVVCGYLPHWGVRMETEDQRKAVAAALRSIAARLEARGYDDFIDELRERIAVQEGE